jgi:nicotinate-nucleotide pyrophosphorylase (carboxylating)
MRSKVKDAGARKNSSHSLRHRHRQTPLAVSLVRRYLEDDIGYGDATAILFGDVEGKCVILAKEDGMLSGIEFAAMVLDEMGCSASTLARSKTNVRKGTRVLEASGPVAALLGAERTALNILMRMSGIATKTRRILEMARRTNPTIIIAGTRKTTPGFSYFEKMAIKDGGGDTHRLSLDDMAMIKDNHVAACGGVGKAVKILRKQLSFSRKIEAEAQDLEMALEAARAGADIVMLDNFTPLEARKTAIRLRKEFPGVLIEISGGITEETVARYAPHADIISMGALTHSYRSMDFSLELE